MKKSDSKSQQKKECAFPVLKFDYNFNVIYSNNPANTILNHWDAKIKETVPTNILNTHPEIYNSLRNPAVADINIDLENTVIRCTVVPFPEAGYIGIYGYMVEYTEKISDRTEATRLN
ncbi:MAG TPA: hypothetical protein VJY62_13950 [Bacteroidia bacterium]|nr:hypothetical protein [Bacteroidia bacterium]